MFCLLNCLEDIRRYFVNMVTRESWRGSISAKEYVGDFNLTTPRLFQEDRTLYRKQAVIGESPVPDGLSDLRKPATVFANLHPDWAGLYYKPP